MRYFYDTEFIEDGRVIDLISIGIVAEDGREYYAISTEFSAANANAWVRDNVLDKLPSPGDPAWKPRHVIRDDILKFFTDVDQSPELWAWVGSYDHVVLAQLWGDMAALPSAIPRVTYELKQYWMMAGKPKLPPNPQHRHDALADARYNLIKFQTCAQALPLEPFSRRR